MIIAPAVRLDLAQKVFREIFGSALGIDILWGASDLPRRARPFGVFMWLTGPDIQQLKHDRESIVTASSYDVTVPTPVDNTQYKLRLNGVPLTHTTGVGDTTENLRDAFIALVNTDQEPAEAATLAANQFSVAETSPSGIFSLSTDGLLSLSVSPSSTAGCAILHSARSLASLSFQVVSETAQMSGLSSSLQLASKAIMALDLESTQNELFDNRLTLMAISAPINLTDLAPGGARFEGRTTFDLEAQVTSVYAEPASNIEIVEGSVTIDGDTHPIDIP